MTPTERAEKIAFQFSGRDFKVMDEGRIRELLIDKIAFQIAEAEREAVKKWFGKTADAWPDFCFGFDKGFTAARDQAAGIAEISYSCPDKPEICNDHCCLEGAGDEIAKHIRAMEPPK